MGLTFPQTDDLASNGLPRAIRESHDLQRVAFDAVGVIAVFATYNQTGMR